MSSRTDTDALHALHAAVYAGDAPLVKALLVGACSALVSRLSAQGVNALHVAASRNEPAVLALLLSVPGVSSCLDSVTTQSSHSSRTPLHLALGSLHLRCAALLLRSGACVWSEDGEGHTAAQLLSTRLSERFTEGPPSLPHASALHSWGVGTNYTLGCSGRTEGVFHTPARLEAFTDGGSSATATAQPPLVSLSASKFHSAAVDAQGRLYTWGWGCARTGQWGAATLLPNAVRVGGTTCRERVLSVACGKHHTLCCTREGGVYAWGCSRDGRLGLGAHVGDSDVTTPRRLPCFGAHRQPRIAALAASSKHSVALTADGCAVFTWGCNAHGQLGYGVSERSSSDSSSSPSLRACGAQPRQVELRGRRCVAVAAAKQHTLALTAEGEVLAWGHKCVTPRRVAMPPQLAQPQLRCGRWERGRFTAVAAGAAASLGCLATGQVVTWCGGDVAGGAVVVSFPTGTGRLVSVAASKRRCCALTAAGDVFLWDAAVTVGIPAAPLRVPGITRVALLALGEQHSLAAVHSFLPTASPCLHAPAAPHPAITPADCDDVELRDIAFQDDDGGDEERTAPPPTTTPMSLKNLCEDAAARHHSDPRCALSLAEAADALQAPRLRTHALLLALQHLDVLLCNPGTQGAASLADAPEGVLVELEALALDGAGVISKPRAESCSCGALLARVDAMTAAAVACGDWKDVEDEECDALSGDPEGRLRCLRALRKKLTAVEALEAKLRLCEGAPLDASQLAKLARKGELAEAVAAMERGTKMTSFAPRKAEPPRRHNSIGGGAHAAPALPAAPVPAPVPAPISAPPTAPHVEAPMLASPPPAQPAPPALPARGLKSVAAALHAGASAAGRRPHSFVSLSRFLAGSLDAPDAVPEPYPSPVAVPHRSWDGRSATSAHCATSPSPGATPRSLRSIMESEATSAAASAAHARRCGYSMAASAAAAPGRAEPSTAAVHIPLSALLPRSSSTCAVPPKAWGASVSLSPGSAGGACLRGIQESQSHAPAGVRTTTGFQLCSAAAPPSPDTRWFVPPPPSASPASASLKEIQRSEAAMRALQADEALARALQEEEHAAAAAAGAAVVGAPRTRRGRGAPKGR